MSNDLTSGIKDGKGSKSLVFRFVLGVTIGFSVSIISAVLLFYNKPLKSWFSNPPPIDNNVKVSCFGDAKFLSFVDNDGRASLWMRWDQLYDIDYYRVFRRKIGFDDYALNTRRDAVHEYTELGGVTKDLLISDFVCFTDQTKIGIYVYKIQAYYKGKLVDEKEYCWFHRLKVKVANDVNVRRFIDTSFGIGSKLFDFDQEIQATKGDIGYVLAGPVETNAGLKHYWWNIVWEKNKSDGSSIVGWSVKNLKETMYLEFLNVFGKPKIIDTKRIDTPF